jgi:hypothetical protein
MELELVMIIDAIEDEVFGFAGSGQNDAEKEVDVRVGSEGLRFHGVQCPVRLIGHRLDSVQIGQRHTNRRTVSNPTKGPKAPVGWRTTLW